MGERDNYGVWDGHIHTAVFKMHYQQGPTVQHMELYSMLRASLDGSGVWGTIETFMCMAKSFCCSLENITLLFVNQLHPNTKLKKNEDIRQASKKKKKA